MKLLKTLKINVNSLEKNLPDVPTLIQIDKYNTDKENFGKNIGEVDEKILYKWFSDYNCFE